MNPPRTTESMCGKFDLIKNDLNDTMAICRTTMSSSLSNRLMFILSELLCGAIENVQHKRPIKRSSTLFASFDIIDKAVARQTQDKLMVNFARSFILFLDALTGYCRHTETTTKPVTRVPKAADAATPISKKKGPPPPRDTTEAETRMVGHEKITVVRRKKPRPDEVDGEQSASKRARLSAPLPNRDIIGPTRNLPLPIPIEVKEGDDTNYFTNNLGLFAPETRSQSLAQEAAEIKQEEPDYIEGPSCSIPTAKERVKDEATDDSFSFLDSLDLKDEIKTEEQPIAPPIVDRVRMSSVIRDSVRCEGKTISPESKRPSGTRIVIVNKPLVKPAASKTATLVDHLVVGADHHSFIDFRQKDTIKEEEDPIVPPIADRVEMGNEIRDTARFDASVSRPTTSTPSTIPAKRSVPVSKSLSMISTTYQHLMHRKFNARHVEYSAKASTASPICPICHIACPRRLEEHMKEKHKEDWLMNVSKCSKEDCDFRSLSEHDMRTHHQAVHTHMYREWKMRTHLLTLQNNPQCPFCNHVVQTVSEFIKHMEISHRRLTTYDIPFLKCGSCRFTSSSCYKIYEHWLKPRSAGNNCLMTGIERWKLLGLKSKEPNSLKGIEFLRESAQKILLLDKKGQLRNV